jgi:predicted HicB family RNase H-like nuclease
MEKNIEYYMSLPYRIEIQPIPAGKGGGYDASIPKLGKRSVCGYGATIEEALNDLPAVKEERLRSYLEENLNIPEPDLDEDNFSGKFVIRIPKSLRRELSQRAGENNVSLNQLITSMLSSGLVLDTYYSALQDLKQEVRFLRIDVHHPALSEVSR